MAGPDTDTTRRTHALTLFVFIAVVILGGGNFVGVSIQVEEMPPFLGAALRFGAAAVIMLAFIWARRIPLPRGGAMWAVIAYGALGFGAFYAFAYWALQHIHPAVASIVTAAVPLVTLFLAIGHGLESFSWRGLAGGLLAIAGIGVMFARSAEGAITVGPVIALLLATACIAESAVIAKRYVTTPPIVTNALGMATGTIILVAGSLLAGETWALPSQGDTWLALGYLIVLGSVALFAAFLYVLARWTASATSYATVLFPFVTAALAAWIQDRPITSAMALGGMLVVAGVWFGAVTPGLTRRRHPAAA